MFSNVTIGILFALGAGAWVYAKMMRSTGSNLQSSLIVTVIAAGFAFLAVITLLSFVPGN